MTALCLARFVWPGGGSLPQACLHLFLQKKTKTIIIILTPINLQYSCCDGVIFADQYIGLALIRMLFCWSSQFSIKR